VKELGLIIDLNQPLVSEESAIKRSITDFYNPLARLLKSYKNVSFSLNIPLSTLELWDKHGASTLISEFKDMYQSEKAELINSSTYSLFLSGLPEKIIESQLILNEYGIGYYLGSRQGFEGEPSIMLRDVTGFLPVFNNMDESVLKVLFDFEYSWFAVKNSNLSDYLFEIDNQDKVLKGVNIVDELNDIIFNLMSGENSYISSENLDRHVYEELNKMFKNIYNDDNCSVVVRLGLKNEDFKPDLNYKNLFRVYESVLDSLSKMFDQVSNVSEVLKFKGKLKKYSIDDYLENTKIVPNEKEFDSNKLVDKNILNLFSNYESFTFNDINENDLSSIKLWDLSYIKTLNNTKMLNNTCYLMIISKLMPLMNLKDSKYYKEDESLFLEIQKEIKNTLTEFTSYIDNTEVIEFLKKVD